MGWIVQVDFQNVSFGSVGKLRFQVKGLHLRRAKKSKPARWQRFAHGVSVQVVAVQICYITGIIRGHVALWKIRVIRLGVSIADQTYPSTHTFLGKQIHVRGRKELERDPRHFQTGVPAQSRTQKIMEGVEFVIFDRSFTESLKNVG